MKVKELEQTVKDLTASLKDKEHEIALLSEYLDELEQKPQPTPSEAFLNKKLSFSDASTPILKVRCQNSPGILRTPNMISGAAQSPRRPQTALFRATPQYLSLNLKKLGKAKKH